MVHFELVDGVEVYVTEYVGGAGGGGGGLETPPELLFSSSVTTCTPSHRSSVNGRRIKVRYPYDHP